MNPSKTTEAHSSLEDERPQMKGLMTERESHPPALPFAHWEENNIPAYVNDSAPGGPPLLIILLPKQRWAHDNLSTDVQALMILTVQHSLLDKLPSSKAYFHLTVDIYRHVMGILTQLKTISAAFTSRNFL